MLARQILTAPIIYTHIRNLRGVLESRYYRSTVIPTVAPGFDTLGPHAQKYLIAHGYIESAVQIIVGAHRSSRTGEDFSFLLSRRGLPLTEGLFLWDLINLSTHVQC